MPCAERAGRAGDSEGTMTNERRVEVSGWNSASRIGGCNGCGSRADVKEIRLSGWIGRVCRTCADILKKELSK